MTVVKCLCIAEFIRSVKTGFPLKGKVSIRSCNLIEIFEIPRNNGPLCNAENSNLLIDTRSLIAATDIPHGDRIVAREICVSVSPHTCGTGPVIAA